MSGAPSGASATASTASKIRWSRTDRLENREVAQCLPIHLAECRCAVHTGSGDRWKGGERFCDGSACDYQVGDQSPIYVEIALVLASVSHLMGLGQHPQYLRSRIEGVT